MIYLLKNGIEANKHFLITPNMCFDQIPIPRLIQSIASWGLPRFVTPTQAHLTGLLSARGRMKRSEKQTYFQFSSEYFKVTEAEIECSCLQRTQVEDNLINGINPLGRDSKQCFQVSSDLIFLYKNGIKPPKNLHFLLQIFLIDTNSKDSPLTCQMGFSLVCNSNRTTHNRTAICPPGSEGVRENRKNPN